MKKRTAILVKNKLEIDEEDIIGEIFCMIQKAFGLAGPNIQGYFV